MSDAGSVLLVVPCFGESSRIGDFLPDLCKQLEELGGCRVLVVDDGSGDTEQRLMNDIVRDLQVRHPSLCDLLLLPDNIGKGGAVYAGWEHHRGAEWLGFVDADGSISAAEVCRLIRLARECGTGRGAIFASRMKMLGHRVDRLWWRHFIGRVYATLVSELLQIPVYDSQCGLKLVPRAAYEKVRENLVIKGFAFDVELLVSLLDHGTEVIEAPIDWHEVAGSKLHLARDTHRMFRDVMRIKRGRLEHRGTTVIQ